MNGEELKDNDKLCRCVGLLEEGGEMTDELLRLLEQDKEMQQACGDLMDCKNAVLRMCSKDVPDVDAEWQRLRGRLEGTSAGSRPVSKPRRSKAHLFAMGILTGVAASLVVLLGYVWWSGSQEHDKEYVAFEAMEGASQVMLQTSNGDRIALARNTKEEILDAVGTTLGKTDTLALTYDAKPKNVKPEEVQTHVVTTPRGHDFKITLADGTVVYMNAESRLEYPADFVGNERNVRLQGEAYFKVAKDAARPFVIHTDNMNARVLGTELNVRNYTTTDPHVTLINGRVEVRDNKNQNNIVSLSPGEDARWRNGTFEVKNVDVDAYIYWKDGYFYFDNMPLVSVLQELGRWYNVNVVFENKALMDVRVRFFCVRSESVERAVSLLNHMKKFRTTVSGNTVYVK